MEFGISLQSVIPVRTEPAHRSEMVTQVLFGELFRVLENRTGWSRIRMEYDGYEGWIDQLQASVVDEQEFLRLENSPTAVTLDLVQLIADETANTLIPVIIGSSLPGYHDQRTRAGRNIFHYEGLVAGSLLNMTPPVKDPSQARQHVKDDAMLFLNAPYLWGGRTPFGIDCSGFVQAVFKLQGIKLLRDAALQSSQGEPVSLLAESETGDLAFFEDEAGSIIHVGIIIDRQRIIHCSGKVRIDSLDHEGIYNQGLQRYTHRLRLIRRII